MKFKRVPLALLLLVAGVQAAQATRPCSLGESEDDILVTIARMGFYRQDRDGVVPEARDHSVGGNGPSPFVVEVFEEGLTGFTAENSTFDGMVRFDWGQISFEEVALFWTGTAFGFDSETSIRPPSQAVPLSSDLRTRMLRLKRQFRWRHGTCPRPR